MHQEQTRLFNEEVNRQNHQRFVDQMNRRHSSGSTTRRVVKHLVSREDGYKFLVAMMKNKLLKAYIEKIKAMGLYADYEDAREWCCVCQDSLNQQLEFAMSFMDKTVRYMKAH
jgi:hypothetical protein